jgi:Spy/CpxP family protein refolding chaperone
MRRTFLLAGLLVLLAAPASAQGGGGGGMGRGRMMGPPQSGQGLLQGITLNADQQKKFDSIYNSNSAMREKARAMMESGQRPDSATRAQMMAQRDASQKAYRAALTPDQQKIFDKNIAEMQERMRSMGGPGGPGGAGGPPPRP